MYNTNIYSAIWVKQLKYLLHSEPPDSSLAAHFSCSTLLLTVDSYSIFKQAVMRKELSLITHHMAFFCACVCVRVCVYVRPEGSAIFTLLLLSVEIMKRVTQIKTVITLLLLPKNLHPGKKKKKKSFPSVDSASSHFGLCVILCERSHTSRPHAWEFPSAGLFLRLVLTCWVNPSCRWRGEHGAGRPSGNCPSRGPFIVTSHRDSPS